MLNENIKNLRKAKGFSQEELAIRLNVVRQTLSKWEQGLSVPDAQMLIRIAEALDTSVSALLGDSTETEEQTEVKLLAAKLELLNTQLAKQNERRRKLWRTVFITVLILAAGLLAKEIIAFFWRWTYTTTANIIGGTDGPTAIFIAGDLYKLWLILFGNLTLAAAIVGICLTRKR